MRVLLVVLALVLTGVGRTGADPVATPSAACQLREQEWTRVRAALDAGAIYEFYQDTPAECAALRAEIQNAARLAARPTARPATGGAQPAVLDPDNSGSAVEAATHSSSDIDFSSSRAAAEEARLREAAARQAEMERVREAMVRAELERARGAAAAAPPAPPPAPAAAAPAAEPAQAAQEAAPSPPPPDGVQGQFIHGEASFNRPSQMGLNESALVEVQINLAGAPAPTELGDNGDIVTREVQITREVEARLSSPDFRIEPVSQPGPLAITDQTVGRWSWRITPLRAGEHRRLKLEIYGRVAIGGEMRSNALVKQYE
ncbi:MAG: hypothetical protein AB7L65_00705, partial [Hyphomonadaceae bacterium]